MVADIIRNFVQIARHDAAEPFWKLLEYSGLVSAPGIDVQVLYHVLSRQKFVNL